MFRFFFLFLVFDGFCGRHIVKIGNGMLVCQLAIHPDVKPEDDRNEDRCKQTDLEHSARAVEIEDGTDECDVAFWNTYNRILPFDIGQHKNRIKL